MNKTFRFSAVAQSTIIFLYLMHRFYFALGSNLLFVLAIIALINGLYLLYLSFFHLKTLSIFAKIAGIILGLFPIVVFIIFTYFILNFDFHT